MSKFENVKVLTHTGKFRQSEKDMFCWGRVVAIHKIGTIEIIEYLPCSIRNDREPATTPYFHINGDSQSTGSLDSAIICALALKYGGLNNQAGALICKMLGIPTKSE